VLQVFFDGTGKLHVEDVPAPVCSSGRVLVQVHSSVISAGTEAASLAGGGSLLRQALRRPDLVQRTLKYAAQQGAAAAVALVQGASENWFPTGYSAAGTIVEVGDGITGFAVGDRVACAGAGFANHAEFISVPQNLCVKIAAQLSFQQAAFTTLGAVALHAVRRAEPTLGETIVVVGSGLIGLLAAQLLRNNGCRVICTDLAPERLALASSFGATPLQAAGGDLVRRVHALTDELGADAVMLCAGSKSSQLVNQAFEMCRERGRVVVVGAVGLDLERNAMYRKEIDLRISRSYGPGRYDSEYEEQGTTYPVGYVRWTETRNLQMIVDLLAAGTLDVQPLVSAEYAVSEAAAAYGRITSGDAAAVGVLLSYPQSDPVRAPQRVWQPAVVPQLRPGQVGLVLVGSGQFARLMHVPNLKALQGEVIVRGVVSATGGNARQTAQALRAGSATTDLAAALALPGVDAVLIATRHNLHAAQSIQALRAGKHVFVEKPLGLDAGECRAVLAEAESAALLCAVGFNRRFSVLAIALKESLDKTVGPKQLSYRVNAGALPADHWLLTPAIGGGRLVGEGCHFFDMLCWLCGSEPVSVAAQSVGATADDVACTLKFLDGSVATFVYSALGDARAGKERIEVMAGGGLAILEDFKSLVVSGMPGRSRRLRVADKGHRALLRHFLNAVRGREPLRVSARDGLRAALCAAAAQRALAIRATENIEAA
jgi:predicted dehydrogenase/threonine dehydrogenase-like Zn-dependent dehydrogenase